MVENGNEWEFIIPLTKEELLNNVTGQYFVENVVNFNTCWKNLKDIKKQISGNGCLSIIQNFDVMYSLFSYKDISFAQLQEIYDSVIGRLVADIDNFVREALKQDDPVSKQEAINVIKMNVYIFSLFVKCYEDKLLFNSENFLTENKRTKGTKTKPKPSKFEDTWDWNMQKKVVFVHIYGMLQQKLNILWRSHIVEESLISLIANCCYKVFEHPDMAQAKLKSIRDSVSHVLAILVASYNYGLTFIPKIIQLMKQYEHTAAFVSSTVVIMATEYNCTTVIPKILKELNSAILEEDVPGLAKSTATFITEIAEIDTALFLSSINVLAKNLVVEPYVVRNATLIAFCELILKSFSIENIDEEAKDTRDLLLKYLHNHLRDQNSYVRSKVLQLWCKLASAHAIPKHYIMTFLQTAKNRLSDKSSIAVKSAIQLFTVILKENPYAGKLNIKDMRKQYLQAKAALKNINSKRTLPREELWKLIKVDLIFELNKFISNLENEDTDSSASPQNVDINDVLIIIIQLLQKKHFGEAITLLKQCEIQFPDAQEIRCNMDKKNDIIEYYLTVFEKIFTKSSDINDRLPQDFSNFSEEYVKQKAVVDYFEDSMNFTELMNDVGKDVNNILKSKSIMGVTEAIEFFTVAYQFGVADAKTVMPTILLLVRCDQATIKDAVGSAYKKLYLTTFQKTPKARAMQIAQRLTNLLKDLDLEQKGALEDLINMWIQNDELDLEFVQVLWEKFDKKDKQISDEESLSALILLDMMANKKPSLVSSNIETIIDAGLCKHKDLMAVEYSCTMLSKLSLIRKDGKPLKLPSDHELFIKITNLLVSKFNDINTKGYKPMSIAAVNMISKICCYPEKVLDMLVKGLYEKLFDSNENLEEIDIEEDMFESPSTSTSIKEAVLERLLLIHGEILFRKWQYLSNDVLSALSKTNKIETATNGFDAELDEFEAEFRDAEDDALANTVNELCEELMLDNTTVDAHIRDLVIRVCTDANEHYSKSLKTAAATSLSKYMVVSQGFCEEKIQLFVTLMEKSKEEIVRSNLVLAFGDLLMRYPNVIEPWTPHLFTRLTDTSTLVRKNTVIVISHLVTREMIKVRGHVAEICLCLDDPEPSIAENVHSLFMDLARKGNTLYNIVPDIVSRLSNLECSENITPEVFDKIMKFILGLIGKERQNEQLVEKLCTRLCESNDTRQWRDLSFCLTQISYNEKSLRKLIDALSHFNDRLLCPDVHSAIVTIFNNAQKSTKSNLKEIVNEGSEKLDELITRKDKDDNKEKETNTTVDPLCTPCSTTKKSVQSRLRSSRKPRKLRI